MKRQDFISDEKLKKLRVSEPTKKAIGRLAEYNLSFLTENFHEGELRTFSPEQLFPLIKHFGFFDIKLSRQLEIEFKKFIAVTLLREKMRSAPSGPVDMYWHFFVLHTESYVKFCKEIWGAYGPQPRKGKHYFQDTLEKFGTEENPKKKEVFVDHEPATDTTRPRMYRAYAETREIYIKVFGKPDNMFWPDPRAGAVDTTCGDSYSGFIPKVFELEE